jgi:antibiotic biosynthesis monooxygenase (ABM) superfamily enzyme
VPIMTWLVMPRVTRLLRSWLYPDRLGHSSRRVTGSSRGT